jgi:hypothetical protein
MGLSGQQCLLNAQEACQIRFVFYAYTIFGLSGSILEDNIWGLIQPD